MYLLKGATLLTETVFTALMQMSDENSKYEEIHRLSFPLIEKNPKVFPSLLISSNSVKEHVKQSNITASVTYLHLLNITEKVVYF